MPHERETISGIASRRHVIAGLGLSVGSIGCLGAGEKLPTPTPSATPTQNLETVPASQTQRSSKPDESDQLTDTGELINGFRPGAYEGSIRLPFRLFVPDAYENGQGQERFPIVLALHGAGKRGSNNRDQIPKNGNNAAFYASNRVQATEQSFVLAPQCPNGRKWSQLDNWKEGSTPMREITAPMESTIALLDAVVDRFPIDTDRQYVAGFSMGGYGTWDAICRFPDRFTAATPMSGGGHPERAHLLDNVRVWAFHGAKDPTVPVESSREMISAMREAGIDPKYTEYPDAEHFSVRKALEEETLPQWMFGGVENGAAS